MKIHFCSSDINHFNKNKKYAKLISLLETKLLKKRNNHENLSFTVILWSACSVDFMP